MNDSYLASVIEDCLRALRGGASRDDCLRAYPELRLQLEPILLTAGSLQGLPQAELNPSAKDRVRGGLVEAIGREPRAERRLNGIWIGRLALVPAVAAAIAAIMVLVSISPFGGTGVARADTVLTVLQGTVLVETETGLVTARDGMLLRPTDRVITQGNGRAVLTFFDGSTVTLESDTSVLIDQVSERNKQLVASLTQETGQTWTHIPADLGLAEVRINTPNALVATADGTFETRVDDGQTQVSAGAGDVVVESGDSRTDLSGGSESAVETAGVVTDASPAQLPQNELVVVVRGAAFAYLTDSSGSTAGILAPGVPINQITGSSVRRDGDSIIIRIPNPADGGYVLGLASRDGGGATVSALMRGDGTATQLAKLDLAANESWTVRFAVQGDDVRPSGVQRNNEPVAAPAVVTDAAADKALAATPEPRPDSTSTPEPKPSVTPEPTATHEPEPTATPRAQLTPVADRLDETSPLSPTDAN